jgi:hypothetical protein
MTVSYLQSLGLSVSVNGGKLRLDNLDTLPMPKRIEVVELARKHKPEIIKELSGGFDLARLAVMLREAGLYAFPWRGRGEVHLFDSEGRSVSRTDTRPVVLHIREHEAEALEALRAVWKGGPAPGLCEVCPAAGPVLNLNVRGVRCSYNVIFDSIHNGKPPELCESARINCPLEGRTIH